MVLLDNVYAKVLILNKILGIKYVYVQMVIKNSMDLAEKTVTTI